MVREGEEARFIVIPVVLVPGDVVIRKECGATQQGA